MRDDRKRGNAQKVARTFATALTLNKLALDDVYFVEGGADDEVATPVSDWIDSLDAEGLSVHLAGLTDLVMTLQNMRLGMVDRLNKFGFDVTDPAHD